jgi:two-component system phosphate regulon sensor histidine kinase PhoR
VFRGLSSPGPSRRLLTGFVLLLLLPAAAVLWLGLRLVVQDRQIEEDDLRKRQEGAAKRVALELTDRLDEAEAALDRPSDPGDDAIVAAISADGVVTYPPKGLLFRPLAARDDTAVLAAFLTAEALELQSNDLHGAEAAYRALTSSSSAATRAEALVRLARVLRKQDRDAAALTVYEELARVSGGSVDGVPAGLVALRARCVVFQQQGNTSALEREARVLRTGLLSGTWPVDEGTFRQYEAESGAWSGDRQLPNPVDVARAEAVERLWQQRGTRGRQQLTVDGIDMTLVWKPVGTETVALIAGPAYQRRHWLEHPRVIRLVEDFSLAFDAPAETPPELTGSDRRVMMRSSDSGLPWNLVVSAEGTGSRGARRRTWLIAALGFLCLLVLAGGYVTARAISRELAVARLQADFVASVSHEFRTPLTSLRQFTDLLNDADVPEEKRRGFYAAQRRATDRLQRLVESLLDFRRMEAEAHPYQRRRLVVSELVDDVVMEFRREVEPRGFAVELDRASDAAVVEADPEALSLAIWNLLDNAVKYSGDSRQVRVSLSREGGGVAVAIRDAGMGIPRDEQRDVFRKFVRGREAKRRSIRGTGLGLAMVKHIVEGHGGRIEVESAPGAGSTFRVVLPEAA